MAGISIPQFKRELKTKHAAGMDIERTGIESIDSFDAKSYECRNEFLGIRFDVESNSPSTFDSRIERGCVHSTVESNGWRRSVGNRSIRSNRVRNVPKRMP